MHKLYIEWIMQFPLKKKKKKKGLLVWSAKPHGIAYVNY